MGYNRTKNLATVNSPKENGASSPADNFTSAWTVKEKPITNYGSENIFTATYAGNLGMADFKT